MSPVRAASDMLTYYSYNCQRHDFQRELSRLLPKAVVNQDVNKVVIYTAPHIGINRRDQYFNIVCDVRFHDGIGVWREAIDKNTKYLFSVKYCAFLDSRMVNKKLRYFLPEDTRQALSYCEVITDLVDPNGEKIVMHPFDFSDDSAGVQEFALSDIDAQLTALNKERMSVESQYSMVLLELKETIEKHSRFNKYYHQLETILSAKVKERLKIRLKGDNSDFLEAVYLYKKIKNDDINNRELFDVIDQLRKL
jgi:hypothetical protein